MVREFVLIEHREYNRLKDNPTTHDNEIVFDTILLLTNCEVHTAKYSDRSFEKLRSEYFPYGTNNCLIRALLYSHQ